MEEGKLRSDAAVDTEALAKAGGAGNGAKEEEAAVEATSTIASSESEPSSGSISKSSGHEEL